MSYTRNGAIGGGGGGGVAAVDTSAYAEITLTDNVVATTLTTQNTWYQVLPVAWGNDQTPVRMTINGAAGTITAAIASTFATNCTLAFTTGASANTLQFAIFKDGVQVVDHKAITWIDSSTYPNTVTITGIDALAIGNVLDVRVRCTTAAGIAIIVTDANFSVFSVTGTSIVSDVSGSGVSGQVTLWNGATSITGDAGCTWTGTGASFVATFGGGIAVGDGTSAAPSLALSGPIGFFRPSVNRIGVALAGIEYARFGSNLQLLGKVELGGAITAPAIVLSGPSAGILLVEDGSGAARDVKSRTSFTLAIDPYGSNLTLYDNAANSLVLSGHQLYSGISNWWDLGVAGSTWRTGYFGTSVVTPVVSGGTDATGTNIAGTTTTVAGQLGTGTGASGDQVFTVGTPQASGATQHVAATALTLHNAGSAGTAAPQVIAGGVVRLAGYTVATLPAGTVGDTAYCTDLTAPTYMAVAVGGGAVVGKVFYDGTNWITQ